jgi:hypothetical protein
MGTIHGTVLTDLSKYSNESKKKEIYNKHKNRHGKENVTRKGDLVIKRN